MKMLLALVLALFTTTAQASGTVSVGPDYWTAAGKVLPFVGIDLSQNVLGFVILGHSDLTMRPGIAYLNTNFAEVELRTQSKFTYAVGVGYSGDLATNPTLPMEANVHARVKYQIW
jgi:hypothetical protein